jgi:hypothetical protein
VTDREKKQDGDVYSEPYADMEGPQAHHGFGAHAHAVVSHARE